MKKINYIIKYFIYLIALFGVNYGLCLLFKIPLTQDMFFNSVACLALLKVLEK